MKKIILMTISMILILSASVSANADLYNEDIQNDLHKLGIMTGDENGNLNLDNTLSRAEAVKLICTAGKFNTEFPDNDIIFPDVSTDYWGYKYIRAAFNEGIVVGDEKGCFNPQNTVTNEEFIKMLVCLLGYEPLAEQRGGYPAGYTATAAQYGLTEDFTFEINTAALRKDTAVLIWRALDIPVMMEKNQRDDSVAYCIMDGKKGMPLVTLRNGTTNWDTSKENIANYLAEFASQYPYKEGDTEFSFKLYPHIIYTSGIDRAPDGTEYEAPAMYFDEMAQGLLNNMEHGTTNIIFHGHAFETDYIKFDSKYLVPVQTISKLGLDVSINPAMYLATIKNDKKTLEIQPNVIGMRRDRANGFWIPLEVCARIYNDTFYVPLDAIINEFQLMSIKTKDSIIIRLL